MAQNGPLVSVVIPTYNRADVICRTIDNAFQQTYSNFEVIVVNDGSTDDTQSRLRQYGGRIRVITQANAGPAVARNRGVEIAHGQIVAFQDSDDLWKPRKLERQVALLAKYGPSVPCCLCNVIMRVVKGRDLTSFDLSLIHPRHEEGIWLNVAEVLSTRFVLFNQAVAIRREAFEKAGGFDEELKYLEDYDLPLRLALTGPWAFIREPLVIYSESSAESFSKQALKEPFTLNECALKIFERTLASIEEGDQHASLRPHLKRQLRNIRRGIDELKLSEMSFWGARAMAHLSRKVGRYQGAIFRRSPWFPKMISIPSGPTAINQGNPWEPTSAS